MGNKGSSPKASTPKSAASLEKDGQKLVKTLSRETATKIQQKFNKLQMSKLAEQFLTTSKGKKLLPKEKLIEMFGLSGLEECRFVERLLELFDKNGDGNINFEEFLLGVGVVSKGTTQEKVNFVFQLYDIDGDGRITQDELYAVMKDFLLAAIRMNGILDEEAAALQLTENIDADPDAKAALKELVDDAFKAYDKNSDDELTVQEFKSWLSTQEKIVEFLGVEKEEMAGAGAGAAGGGGSVADLEWIYKDADGTQYGPFSNSDMRTWFTGAHLDDPDWIYKPNSSAGDFKPLKDLFPILKDAFLAMPSV